MRATREKMYLLLAAASFAGIFAAFILLVLALVSDPFGVETEVFDILLTIFLYFGLIGIMTGAAVYFMIKYAKAKNGQTFRPLTKRCVSCGHEMGITELSCPRCFILQPPEDRSGHIFRKK